jgi:hypothetical protein
MIKVGSEKWIRNEIYLIRKEEGGREIEEICEKDLA